MARSVVMAAYTVRAALWLLGARACLLIRPGLALAPRSPSRRRAQRPPETTAQLVAAVQRAARYLPIRPTCLEQVLALERLLHASGVDASIVLGVRRTGTTIAAHAWLESPHGTLLGEPPDGCYRPLHRTRPE